ncbi:Uu.00g039830.m01.CDS01 [Anthostomella pinea]|uniref:Uu.00g039830.m01.CDS01 n=1 Tax=Anthostomella pinea TaxID=933095 RepID=A0AAI8VB19_9PEZI|nr:Uu.00g039830.m01.CDS01 [Anthostomella pinea]
MSSPVMLSDLDVQTQPGVYDEDPNSLWARDEPYRQPFHVFADEDQAWHATMPTSTPELSTSPPSAGCAAKNIFQVLAWNISFERILPLPRMQAALDHLRTHLVGNSDETETVIETETARAAYYDGVATATATGRNNGTCMLIPKNGFVIRDVFRVHYAQSSMQRDALFVDINITSAGGGWRSTLLRLCTMHLESLRAAPPKRPHQLAVAARYLHAAPGVVWPYEDG